MCGQSQLCKCDKTGKIIGSSLEADVEIVLPKAEFDILKKIDAKELFITSNVTQNILKDKKNEISVTVKKAGLFYQILAGPGVVLERLEIKKEGVLKQ